MSGARTSGATLGGNAAALARLVRLGEYPESLTIAELAAIIDYTKRGIGRWISEGLITVDRLNWNTVRIPVKGLEFLPPFGQLLITNKRAQDMTGMSKGQIEYAHKVTKRFRAVRMPGGQYRFYFHEIKAITASRKEAAL